MLGAFNRLRRAKTAGFSFGSRRKYREGPEEALQRRLRSNVLLISKLSAAR